MTATEKAILQTLAYSAVFNFPLTKKELWRYLISDTVIAKNDFEESLSHLPKKIISKDNLYALAEDEDSIKRRKQSTSLLQHKLRIAKRAAYYLSYIPTIQLIGISGSIAMGKAEKPDDIDLFIVTKKHTLFMTRAWVHAVLEILNLRRKRLTINAQDKVCVNLLIDEQQLIWPGQLRDVYTAHEIAHMKPLFERNNMYETFLDRNAWIRDYLPNAFDDLPTVFGADWRRNYVTLRAVSAIITRRPFEKFAQKLQKRRMKRHRTTETVTEKVLAFHPVDYRSKTLASLNTKYRQLGLLTNK